MFSELHNFEVTQFGKQSTEICMENEFNFFVRILPIFLIFPSPPLPERDTGVT